MSSSMTGRSEPRSGPGQAGLGRLGSHGGKKDDIGPGTRHPLRRIVASAGSFGAVLTGPLIVLSATLAVAAVVPAVATAAQSCANAAIRVQQGVERLPNCRAYEQVTPKIKNGAAWKTGDSALSAGESTVLSSDGNRMLGTATMAFPSNDLGTLNLNGTFVLERKKNGWRDLYVSPTPGPIPDGQVPTQVNPSVIGQSRDFSVLSVKYFLSFSERDTDGARADNYALRLSGDPSSEQLSSLSAPQLLSCPDDPAPPCAGSAVTVDHAVSGTTDSTVSDDGSTVLFETSEGMAVPGAAGPQIYERTGSDLNEVRWVSQPLSSVPAGVTQVTGTPTTIASSPTPAQAVLPSSPMAWDNALSPDGSRTFFASPSTGSPRIYVRQDHERTLEVSRVRGGSTTAAPVSFRGASEDGNRALIATPQKLLPASGAPPALTSPNATNDLYLWTYRPGSIGDEAPDALVRVTGLEQVGSGPPLDGQTALSVIGQSADLSVFYFIAKTTDASGGQTTINYPQQAHIYRAEVDPNHPGDSQVRFVATTAMAVANDYTLLGGCLNANSKGTTCARSSSDGRYLVFDSSLPLTGDDTEPGCTTSSGGTLTPGVARTPGEPDTAPAGCRSDVFLFDNTQGTLVRVSRGSDPAHDNGPFESSLRLASKQAVRVLDDGSAVFFASTERLVGDDVNDKQDVYEWNRDETSAGHVALLSGGTGTHHSQLLTATADGRSVFFFTADDLAVDDTDTSSDIYAAVRGGGFLVTSPPICEGATCQGPVSSPPAPLNIGSITFGGDGNMPLAPYPVKASVAVKKLKAMTGSVARVRVRVPGAGRILVTGAQVRRTAKSVSKAGSYPVRIVLSPRAKRSLRKKETLKVRARVSFRTKGGQSASKLIDVTVKQPKFKRAKARKKGGR